MAAQRGYEIVQEYTDRISGAKAKRPGLDQMMADARRGRFDVVLVWASDRIARSVKHYLEVLDELNHLNIEFVSFREQIDTGGPLGRAIVVIIGAIAELERSLIIERVRAGMRRARLEGTHIGRNPLTLDHEAIYHDRCQGQSLRQIAKGHRISTATVQRVLHKHPAAQDQAACDKRGLKTSPLTSTKQSAGSHRSGCVKRYSFRNRTIQRNQPPLLMAKDISVHISHILRHREGLTNVPCPPRELSAKRSAGRRKEYSTLCRFQAAEIVICITYRRIIDLFLCFQSTNVHP